MWNLTLFILRLIPCVGLAFLLMVWILSQWRLVRGGVTLNAVHVRAATHASFLVGACTSIMSAPNPDSELISPQPRHARELDWSMPIRGFRIGVLSYDGKSTW